VLPVLTLVHVFDDGVDAWMAAVLPVLTLISVFDDSMDA